MSKKLCVIGNPISHSLSPKMHTYAMEKLGLSGSYEAIRLKPDITKEELKDFIFETGLTGLNVTVPFKELAFTAVTKLEGLAKDIGAVNTIVLKDKKLIGYNTDAPGFYECIKKYDFKSVLILGAGGSAKAISLILQKEGFRVVVANRSKAKLKDFKGVQTRLFSELDSKESYDLVINATSASLEGTLPLEEVVLKELLANAKLAFDLMYKDEKTPFCALASTLGVEEKDGKEMLIYQGALAFLKFFDLEERLLDKVVFYMREALLK
ncbi:shikimate dehydrogenase [Helicobacter sp. 11S02629-2]|uniref:shikimate dehydrogenase n=1 Tax=Helicobacter sp. 11S02629-2 TaxID=1476195 RepID=UPI000BA7865E|nr:shikimate dehydrogenase [Helicobacter sp. 11S02629-2]PAF45970.1 shikimate dehydrogenase [Helicobacter sp. 11S02629-2]